MNEVVLIMHNYLTAIVIFNYKNKIQLKIINRRQQKQLVDL